MARPRGTWSDKAWRDAVRKAVCKRIEDGEHKGRQKLEVMADQLADAGVAGKLDAMREIGDRLDGRAAQSIEAIITDERSVLRTPEISTTPEVWQNSHKPH